MSEEVDKSMEQEKQDSPMKEAVEEENKQSNGETEEHKETKKEEQKSPQKKKVEKKEEEEEEEDGDDEESSDEEQLGSLEGPVQIMKGKRERKKTERLVFEEVKTPQEKVMAEIKPGKGTKLGEIPNVSFQLNRTNAEFLKPVNSLLFGFVGKVTMVKKNIRQFSGFLFEKDDPEYQKKEQKLYKFTMVGLKELCTWFDVERGGNKEAIVPRIMDFLMKPEPSGRPLPEKKKKAPKKAAGKKRKRKDDGGSGDAKKQKKAKKEKKTKKSSEEDGKADNAANDSYDSVSSLSPDSDEEEEAPKKKKAKVDKKTPKKPATPKKTVTPKKSATPAKKEKKASTPKASTPKKKTPVKKTPVKKSADSDSDSSDDEPLVKKTKAEPTEVQIKDTIKKFLDKANLEEVTMKTVCKKVYETYPDFDLTHKKDFIKSTVKAIIS